MITKLHRTPISVGAGAVYEYNKHVLEACKRQAKYPDEDGNKEFNLARVVGPEGHQRIWVPRNMASTIPVDHRVDGLEVQFTSTFVPRNPEQARFVADSVRLLKAGHSFVGRAPTGFGKSYCGSDIIAKIGRKAMVLVNKEDIEDQWTTALEEVLGLKRGLRGGIGIIKGDKVDVVGQKVVIAYIQSVAKEARYPEHIFSDFGLFIPDECHRVGADHFSQSCFRVPARLRFGLSATPTRKDGRDEVVEAHIGPIMVYTDSVPMKPRVIVQQSPWKIPLKRKLDKEGKLVYGKDGEIEMVQMAHSAGRTGHIEKLLMNHHGRNQMIVNFTAQAYKKFDRKILLLTSMREHIDMLSMLIASAGVPTYKISNYVGGLTKAQREKAKEAQVIIATYQMAAEATDIPDVDTLVMCMPKSEIEQIAGRPCRYVEGKKEPLIFDIRDDSSSVFKSYGTSRDKYYKSKGVSTSVHVSKG